MFYLNTIEQLFLFVEQLDQLEVYLPYSRLLAGTPILAVYQNLRRNSYKTSLTLKACFAIKYVHNRGGTDGTIFVTNLLLALISPVSQ